MNAPASPATERSADVEQLLRARYGLDRNPWPRRSAVAIAVAVYLGAAVFAAVMLSRGAGIEGSALSWRAGPTSVAVDVQLRGTSTTAVTCVVRAQDATSTDIGYREFRFDSAPRTETVRLPTLFRASSVSVLGCAPEGEPLSVPPPDFPPGVAIP